MKMIRMCDVCRFFSGGTPSKANAEFWTGKIPWFSPKDIKSFELIDSQDHISQEAIDNSATQKFDKGSLLVVVRSGVLAHSLPVGILRCDGAFNQDIKGIVPHSGFDSEFIAFFLKANEKFILQSGVKIGATVHSVKAGFIERLNIPDFPIKSQRRIAAQLKAQLAEVEKARKAAEVELSDSEALSVAYLRDVFDKKNFERWPIVPLGEAGNVVSGITLGRKTKDEHLREVPYLRVANVKDGHLDLKEIKTIEATETEINKWRLRKGDILLTEGGDPDKLGRGTFWPGELQECIHQNHIFRVRFPADKYQPEFISAQIASPYGKDYFFAHAKKTTGIATINQKVLKAFPIFSPPLEKQKEMMMCLSKKLNETEKITVGFRKRLDEISTLPNRILSQVFDSCNGV